MYRLIYVSTARPYVGTAEIHDILTKAQARNATNDITGLMIHDGKRFLQYLEGEEMAVEATFERIAGNESHFALIVLARGTVEKRQFPDWSMAIREAGIDLADTVAAMVPECDAAVANELMGFAEARDRAA